MVASPESGIHAVESAAPDRKPARPKDALLSIVVPVYNEEDNVGLFLEAVSPVLSRIDARSELVFVNDGSKDQTLERLLAGAERDPRIRIVDLTRNFGKEAALTAGLDHARGDAVIVIDVDLQDPPELMKTFVDLWRDGYDVVYGSRISRDHDTRMKRISAKGFYRLFNWLSTLRMPENGGDFRLLDRKVVEALKLLPERNRFMKGLFAWVGFRSIGVSFPRQARAAGTTKFNYWKLWNFALDGVFSFSTAPLRIWSYIGIAIAGLSFLLGMIIVARVLLFGVDVPGYASLVTIILFLGGVQLLSLGVLGEYIGRLFVEAKRRPIYLVDRVIEWPPAPHRSHPE